MKEAEDSAGRRDSLLRGGVDAVRLMDRARTSG